MSLSGAIRAAPVAVVAPMLYVSLVMGVAVDVVFWGVHPVATTYAGAGIIIAAGVYNIYRDAQLARRNLRG